MTDWTVSASDGGTLDIRTGVTGRASKMGHRLTISVKDWSVTVGETNGAPTSVAVRADVNSLDVVGGEGGLTPMFGPEKMLARSNALNTLEAKKFPDIRYDATDIAETDNGYRLTGALQIHGVTREHVVDLTVSRRDDATRSVRILHHPNTFRREAVLSADGFDEGRRRRDGDVRGRSRALSTNPWPCPRSGTGATGAPP